PLASLHPPISSCFFSYCSRHLTYLHSFPTRRSSDLCCCHRGRDCSLTYTRSQPASYRSPRMRPSASNWEWLTGRRCTSLYLRPRDRKSTRLNSSHRTISYAVFCLKKKKTQEHHKK